MTRCNFDANLVEYPDGRNVLAVVDQSGERGGMTVTNAAEQVVAELARTYALAGVRIVYLDTEGVWDELTHDGARFTGFRPVLATSLDDALLAVRS